MNNKTITIKTNNITTVLKGCNIYGDILTAYKAKTISKKDIKILALAELRIATSDIWNHLYSRCMEMNDENIYYHNFVDDMLESLSRWNDSIYPCFNFLKQNGYIDACGRGYIFHPVKVNIKPADEKRLVNLIWDIL